LSRYRSPSAQERTVLRRAFSKWGVFEFLENKIFLVRVGNERRKQIFLVATEVLTKINSPLYTGLFIGELGKQFVPSLEMAQIIAREGIKFPFIKVSPKGESLVVYGRDVFGDSIVEYNTRKENELVIILNTRSEAIGIGRTRYNPDYLSTIGTVTVTTLADLGQYIRNECAPNGWALV